MENFSKPRLAIGLMSGTSLDGIDAALIEVVRAKRYRYKLRHFVSIPYPKALFQMLLAGTSGEQKDASFFIRLQNDVGAMFLKATQKLIESAGVMAEDITVIGFHGQTIWYENALAGKGGVLTWQMGEPSHVAVKTGVPTVCDFRATDIALGGLGAPLTPWCHYQRFASEGQTRVVHNLGGISNVTVLPNGGLENEILAFDTGPANTLIDALVRKLSGGKKTCDKGGAKARQGRVCKQLLSKLLLHPFLSLLPPKATGNAHFGEKFVEEIESEQKKEGLSVEDVLATVTAFTAASIQNVYAKFILPSYCVNKVILTGGGVKNHTLRKWVKQALHEVGIEKVVTLPADDSDSLEACAFGLMAIAAIDGVSNHIPQATGARHCGILGKIVDPRGRLHQ